MVLERRPQGAVSHEVWSFKNNSRCRAVIHPEMGRVLSYPVVKKAFPDGASGREPTCQCRLDVRDTGLIPGSGRTPGEGHVNPLQYSCLENPMGGGARWAAVHGIAKSQTQLSDFTFTFHFHALEREMASHSSVLAWRIPGMGSLVGCRLWGHTQSDTTEAT